MIDKAAEEAQQAAWLAVREFCVPILGEQEFNHRIRMARTGPDEFELMACIDPVYLAAEATRYAILCAFDWRNADFASRCVAEASARSSTNVDAARAREWASQAAQLRQIVESAGGSCMGQPAKPLSWPPTSRHENPDAACMVVPLESFHSGKENATMASVEESELFRSLSAQHSGVEAWLDDLADTDGWSYYWVVSHPADGTVQSLARVRLGGGQLQRRSYDAEGNEEWLPVA